MSVHILSPQLTFLYYSFLYYFCCFSITSSVGRKHHYLSIVFTVLDVSLNFSVFSLLVHPVVIPLSERSTSSETLTPAVSDYINRILSRDDKKSSHSIHRRQKKWTKVEQADWQNSAAGDFPEPIWLLPTGFNTKQPWPCVNEFQPACYYHLKEAIFKMHCWL